MECIVCGVGKRRLYCAADEGSLWVMGVGRMQTQQEFGTMFCGKDKIVPRGPQDWSPEGNGSN